MAGFQSQPPVETMLSIFEEMPYHAMLDMDALKKVRRFFTELKKERTMSYQQPDNIIDPDILDHHIPGGMISNLRSQLEQQNALDKIEPVFRYLDEPFADPSILPMSLLCENTRKHVTVALGGDGGDELFYGYPTYQAEAVARALGPIRAAAPLLRSIARSFPGHDRSLLSKNGRVRDGPMR